MNQADVTKLMSRLKFAVQPKPRRFRNKEGSEGRLMKFRKTLTALIKYERLELNYPRADEARGYIERLISDAIRHGDCHKETMKMADYWILEKQYVHKLFKVLVPRFQNLNVSYTRLYKAPLNYPCHGRARAVLELRGHPFPSLTPDYSRNRNMIHNVLLDEAKKEFRQAKYAELAAQLAPTTLPNEEANLGEQKTSRTEESGKPKAESNDTKKSDQ